MSILLKHVDNVLKSIAQSEFNTTTDYKIVINVGRNVNNFLSSIVFVRLIKTDSNSDQSVDLVIKLPFTGGFLSKEDQEILFRREILVYTTFIPELMKIQEQFDFDKEEQIHFAKCFETISKPDEDLIILENLNSLNFKMYDRLQSVNYEHMILIVKKLAQLNALAFKLKHENPRVCQIIREQTFNKESGDFLKSLIFQQCKEKAVNCIYDEDNKQKLINYFEKVMNYDYLDFENKETNYNILYHGDFWINNLMFQYVDDKPKDLIMIDWQLIKFGSPVLDLVHILYSSCDEEFRDKYMDEIFDIYYETLQERLSEMNLDPTICYPEEVFRNQIKEKLGHGMIVAVILVPLVLIDKNDVDVDAWNESKEMIGFANAKYNENIIERINGIVRDMIKHEVM